MTKKRGFTILELLVVLAIIIALAGLILATSGYVQKKGARSRAETEIAAVSAALENYKADNGVYPRDTASSDLLDARLKTNPSDYQAASFFLYSSLTGDTDGDGGTPEQKFYMQLKPNQMMRPDISNPPSTSNKVTGVRDPFGNYYGYSTANQASSSTGYNPTFDLWSTVGGTTSNDVPGWVKNW